MRVAAGFVQRCRYRAERGLEVSAVEPGGFEAIRSPH